MDRERAHPRKRLRTFIMLWNHCEYKADEATFVNSLFATAGLDKPEKITLGALQVAAARVCQKQKNPPPSVVAALKRVILARTRAFEFFNDGDPAHEWWLDGLKSVQSQLRTSASQVSKKPHTQRKGPSLDTPDFDSAEGPDAADYHEGLESLEGSCVASAMHSSSDIISYQDSVEDTAIGCIFQSLVDMHRRVSDLWLAVMRGSIDFVSAVELANSARDFAHRSLSELELLHQWPQEKYSEHARRIGLLDDGTTMLKQSEGDSICMMASTPGLVRLHIYSFKPALCQANPSFYPPVIRHMMDSSLSGGLDRSLLRSMLEALEKSPEIKKSLILKEKAIRYAVYRTLFQLIYPGVNILDPAIRTAYESAQDRGRRWKIALESHTFSPDPWTLCHILAQAVGLRNLTNLKFLAPHLPRLICSRQYRKLGGQLEDITEIPQDFNNMFSSLPQTTLGEVRLAYIHCKKESLDRLYERIKCGIPLGWRFFDEGEDILPTICNLFHKPTNYLSLLDRLREVLCFDNSRELDITAFRAERLMRQLSAQDATTELLNVKLHRSFILMNQGFRFMFQAESLDLPDNVGLLRLSDPAETTKTVYMSLSQEHSSNELFCEYWTNNPIPTSVHASCHVSGNSVTEKEQQDIEITLQQLSRPRVDQNVDKGQFGTTHLPAS